MEDWRARVVDALLVRIGEDLSTALVNALGRHRGGLADERIASRNRHENSWLQGSSRRQKMEIYRMATFVLPPELPLGCPPSSLPDRVSAQNSKVP